MRTLLTLAFVCVAPTAAFRAARSCTYVVDESGSGDFTDLQTAIDSVPDGSTLLIQGVLSTHAQVDHPLQLIGYDGARLRYKGPDDPNTSVLEIDVGPDENVLLSNLEIDGDEHFFAYFPDAVRVISVGRLVVEDCTLLGGRSVILAYDSCITSELAGAGIYDAGSTSTIAVTRSVVIGGDGTTNDEEDLENWSSQPQRACDGGDGIYAPDASLLSINDSEVRGGDGGDFTFNCVDGGTDSGPSEIYAGNGGNGVVGDCYVSNSTITAGSGGDAMYNGCGFGIEHDGVAGTDVIGTRIDLADRLAVGVARPGATSTLDGSGFTANGAVLLLLGDGPVGPLSLSKLGLYFLDLRTIVGPISADGTGAFHLSATIPDDQCLIGAAIAMQASDGGPLSEPELVVIQP